MNQNIYDFIIAQSIYKPLNALDLKHRTNLLLKFLSRHLLLTGLPTESNSFKEWQDCDGFAPKSSASIH